MLNILIISILFSINSFAKDLDFLNVYYGRDNSEISGLYFDNGKLLFVADKLSNRSIYQVVFEGNRFYYKDLINLTTLKGHDKYFRSIITGKSKNHTLLSPIDLEGITKCNNTFYLVNEQARDILKIEANKISSLNIDLTDIFKKIKVNLKDISVNAGLEGITADCKNNLLYLAQERDPRAIITIDLKKNKAIDIFQTQGKSKLKGVSLDYADLHFENGFIYILERNNYLIHKLDTKTKKVIDSYSFIKLGKDDASKIYDTGKPFGLAEGLALSKETIYIAFDNNKSQFSNTIKSKVKNLKDESLILSFKRPEGF